MARPAPAVDRIVALLDFLAEHPDDEYSLSELARRLELNKATAHSMLAALTDAGYLLRNPVAKTFALGPALVAIGNAASARQLEIVEFARDEMRSLADELGVQCTASAVFGTEIVILARSGDVPPFIATVRVGDRLPYVPPLGTVFVAWSSTEEIDAWLRRVGPSATDVELARYRRAVETVRRRGYSLGLEADARVRLGRALAEHEPAVTPKILGLIEDLGHEEYILLELEHSASYRLSMVAAPVFGVDGSVALALTLIGFADPLGAAQLTRYAERLVEATRRVTAAIHGREPRVADDGRAG
jgi:DNA-binding IclR family transcriptional regulator